MLIHLRVVCGHFTLYHQVAVADTIWPPEPKVVIKWLLTEEVYQPLLFTLRSTL